MILVDYNQIAFSNYFIAKKNKGEEPTIELLKDMIIRSINKYKREFTEEYGNMILCDDSANPWRKDILPSYKFSRKDVKRNFDVIDPAKEIAAQESKTDYVKIDRLEADDIIALAVRTYFESHKILILSNDKDLKQLHFHSNIMQYSPIQKKYVICNDPNEFLLEHILQGDASDSIPNVLSDDDSLINENKKQERLTKKKKELFKNANVPEEYKRNFERNSKLINFGYIPEELEDSFVMNFIFSDTLYSIEEGGKN